MNQSESYVFPWFSCIFLVLPFLSNLSKLASLRHAPTSHLAFAEAGGDRGSRKATTHETTQRGMTHMTQHLCIILCIYAYIYKYVYILYIPIPICILNDNFVLFWHVLTMLKRSAEFTSGTRLLFLDSHRRFLRIGCVCLLQFAMKSCNWTRKVWPQTKMTIHGTAWFKKNSKIWTTTVPLRYLVLTMCSCGLRDRGAFTNSLP